MTSSKQDMGASADADQALAVPATPLRVDGTSGFDPSREFICEIVEAVRDIAEGRRPSSFGFGSPHSTAIHLRFIEECSQTKPCPSCGTPKHDWTYWKVTLAGQAFLSLAIAMEARQGGDGETRLHPQDDSAGPKDIAQKGSQ